MSARVVVVPPEPERILEAVTPRTRLLALSHVLWTTGQVLPVQELRAESGLPILVDGAQSVGTIPVDLEGLDYYTISGQKWLCGPEGTGHWWSRTLRHSALRAELPIAGELRARWALRASRRRAALRPERHAKCACGRVSGSTRCSTRLAVRAGVRDGRALPWCACRGRSGRRRARGASDSRLLARAGGGVRRVVSRIAEADVIVRDLPGRGLVRASVGWWTDDDDIERLVAAL